MQIVHKLLLATLLPALLIWIVGIYATSVSEHELRTAIELTSLTHASAVMDELDRIVHNRVMNWKAYLRSDLVLETLAASNDEYEGLEDVDLTLHERDELWQSTPAEVEFDLLRGLLRNRLSRDMRGRIRQMRQDARRIVFGEVFLTNRYGANAAQTNRTSDYRQDDEEWWQKARDLGVYVTDAQWDESAKLHSIDLCLRVDDADGNFLGVLKAVMNIEEIVDVVDSRSRQYALGEKLILLNRNGEVIHIANQQTLPSGEAE